VAVTEQRGWEVSAREDQSTEQIRHLFARYREMARGLGVAHYVAPTQAEASAGPGLGERHQRRVDSPVGGVHRMRSLTRPR
jgi:hypothetical protein